MNLNKSVKLLSLVTFASLFLTACMQTNSNGEPTGMFYEYLVVPTQHLLDFLAQSFNGSYGIAIIIVSIVVRLVLLPSSLNQSKKMLLQQEKTAKLKPYIDEIDQRIAQAITQEDKLALQNEKMELYKLNGVASIGATLGGCLPLLLQLPIFSAMVSAIRYSEQISNSTFLGILLGSPYIPIAIVSAAVYVLQSYMSLAYLPEDQKKQMKTMMYSTPIMILMFTWNSPAGLGLYFFVGGIFAVFQTWIQNAIVRPKVKAAIDEELEGKEVILPTRTKTTSPAELNKKYIQSQKKTAQPLTGRSNKKNKRN